MLTIDRNYWNRGTGIDGTLICDSNGKMDIFGIYLTQKGVDKNVLIGKVDLLDLVYEGSLDPNVASIFFEKIYLKDPEYDGLHWTVRPIVNDLYTINDTPLGCSALLACGDFFVDNEQTRENIITGLFALHEEIVKFIN